MMRVVLENMLLFLLPSLVYVAYVLLMSESSRDAGKGGARASQVLDDAPLLWLFAAGAAMVIVTLVAFSSTSGGRPGQHYVPSVLKDGRVEPGHIE